MEINSINDLEIVKNQISTTIQVYTLDGVLLGLRAATNKIDPFISAGVSLFAIKHCTAGYPSDMQQPVEWNKLEPLADLVANFLLADPLSFDKTLQQDFASSNPIFTFLRLFGNQMPFRVSIFGQYAQPHLLFQEIPKEIAGRPNVPNFDFEAEFIKLNQISLTDFLNVAFVAFAAAYNNSGFTRGYFDKARTQGIHLPNDKDLLLILNQLVADPKKFIERYQHFREKNRRFAMYDLNPLFIYPIIRPWEQKEVVPMEQDRLVAPLPNLIAFRASMGIFYQMYNEHTTVFSDYFGYVFEAYVGRVLQYSISMEKLLSEDDIRRTYPPDRGKVPDWVIIDGNVAILAECKATRFSRAAVVTGSEEAVNNSLKQVIKGLKQFHNFIEACKSRAPGLEAFHGCLTFIPILVTLEPLYLINTPIFRQYINDQLANDKIVNLPWLILAVEELEKMQPHVASSGVSLREIFNELYKKPFNTVLEEVHLKTARTFKDSFLYKTHQDLYKQIGFSTGTGSD